MSSTHPFHQFHSWFQEALSCKEIVEARAMCLSTVNEQGRPSSRMVIMKGYSEEEGFKFHTNLNSRKAREMCNNPEVCLLFYWLPLDRQVRIEGTVDRISDKETVEYFNTEPRRFQLSALVTHQSQLQRIESRAELEERYAEMSRKYSDESVPIPKPENRVGYKVQPRKVEFWQGQSRSTRLDDRIVFEKVEGSENWTIYRLAP